MADDEPFDEERALSLAYVSAGELAKDCAQLKEIIEGLDHWESKDVLGFVIDFLATSLVDQGFSPTEIRAAFFDAVTGLDRYAAGEER